MFRKGEDLMGYKIISADLEIKNAVKNEREIRRSKPTREQIEEVLQIVQDFGYRKKAVPEFNTYAELDAWRRRFVKSKCCGV